MADYTASALIGIGVVYPQCGQYLGFKALHLKGLCVSDVIIAQNMEETVHHQMGEMVLKTLAQFERLALESLAGERNVTQDPNDRAEGFDLGEAQHIGGAVLAAPLLVQLVLLGIVGEQDREFGRALELGFGLREGFEYSALGQRIEILRPGFVVADNGDIERRDGQRIIPSVAFSASFLAVSAS